MGKLLFQFVCYALALIAVVYSAVGVFSSGGVLPLLLLPVILALLLPAARDKVKERLGWIPAAGPSLWLAIGVWLGQLFWFGTIQESAYNAEQLAAQQASQQRIADARQQRREAFTQNKPAILEQVQTLINEGKAGEALGQARQYIAAGVSDPDLQRLAEAANIAVMKAEIADEKSLTPARRVEILEALIKAEPNRAAQYTQRLKTAQSELAAMRAAEAKAAARREFEASAKAQFSGWDGSHRGVEQAIKARMNNPKSYEHVETRFVLEDNNEISVVTQFRGTNAFGGIVTNVALARVNAAGQVLALSIN